MKKALDLLDEFANSASWKLLGIQVDEVNEEYAKLSFDVQPQFLQSYGIIQGGFIFTLLDAAGAAAASFVAYPKKVVTLEAKINYLQSIKEGKMYAFAKIVHLGKSTVVTSLNAYDTNGKHLATGLASFSILS